MPRFTDKGARLAVVTQGEPDQAAAFCAQHGVADHVTCLADPKREAYRAFGLERGSWNDILGPKVLGAGLRAWRHGVALPPKGQDVRQLGGAFVIDRDGHFRLAHRASSSADRATVDALLAALP